MDLRIAHNDLSNTLLVVEDDPYFEIKTWKTPTVETTTILRVDSEANSGRSEAVVGCVEHCPTQGVRLQLGVINHELILHSTLSVAVDSSWSFIGPDSRPYRWQLFIQYPVLILNDSSNTLLARYRRAKVGIVSRSRKAFLEILPAGLSTIDLIVVTLVFFMKQRVTVNQPGPE